MASSCDKCRGSLRLKTHNVSGFQGHCLSRLSITGLRRKQLMFSPGLVALWRSMSPLGDAKHRDNSRGRRQQSEKCLHIDGTTCLRIQVLGGLLQVPVMWMSVADTLVVVGTQDLEVPRRRWLSRPHSLPVSQHLVGGVINTFAERVKICAHVWTLEVVCFSLDSMLSEISHEGNTGRRFSAPRHAHLSFLVI